MKQQTTTSFLSKLRQIEQKAIDYIRSVVIEPIEFWSEDKNEDHELSDMPNFQYYDRHGLVGMANTIGIYKDEKGFIKVKGILEDDGNEVSVLIEELDPYSCCAIADMINPDYTYLIYKP